MDKHFSSILRLTFPDLYSEDLSFNVGNGWFSLLCGLSIQIQSELYNLEDNCRKSFKIFQIKQKHGRLNYYPVGGLVYYTNGDNEIYNLIIAVEEKSSHICENCGKPGYVRNINDWRQTLCNICSIMDKK